MSEQADLDVLNDPLNNRTDGAAPHLPPGMVPDAHDADGTLGRVAGTGSGALAGGLVGTAAGGPIGAVVGAVAGAVMGDDHDDVSALTGSGGELGRYAGSGAGALSGALIGEAVAGPPGAVLGAVVGGIWGAAAGDTAKDFGAATAVAEREPPLGLRARHTPESEVLLPEATDDERFAEPEVPRREVFREHTDGINS